MEHAEGRGPSLPTDLLCEVETAAALNPEELAERSVRLLRAAARPGGPEGFSASADRVVVQALDGAGDPDAALARIELDLLAGLADRVRDRLRSARAPVALSVRRQGWEVLDLLCRSSVLRRIPGAGVPEWSDRFLALVEASGYTFGPLFRRRVERYGSKTLFELPKRFGATSLSWRQTAARVQAIAHGLLAAAESMGGEPGPVAILSENRPEMALVDLACLTSGIVNVMIPASATRADVGYMLKHSGARMVVVSTRDQLDKVARNRGTLPDLKQVVVMDAAPAGSDAVTLDDLVSRGISIPAGRVEARAAAVAVDDLATVMYTSGTTGMPKGIRFSHRNIVFKRFARALALPEIGENDVFVCYLPLFHTFGRYLEMTGCIFWGATYCFLPSPAVETVIEGMRHYRPTVFISVPKKWIQIHEAVARRADPLEAGDEELLEATRSVTGGRLRFGLSAAGHLDADIFRFLQRQEIELMSGFGMTEATGGITMTPPGEYREDSLGVPLPGIECRLADDDGEMLIRGPYVMIGYLNPPDGESSFDAEGWFHTGDVMEVDSRGHYRLVDRKKEIYKNVQGETIAPQRVENLFRDFESVSRIFLVGDHRPYNTALIHPNPDYGPLDFRSLSPEEMHAHFRSLVVSVNKFLAPFERIVDFALIHRDLEVARGELTPKGTPRRSVVQKNFADVIERLYRRTVVHVGGAEITFPNWLLQALGLTAPDVGVRGDRITLPAREATLRIRRLGSGRTQVGSCVYRHRPGVLNLGDLLTLPRLWLGNRELVEFVPLDLAGHQRARRASSVLEWEARVGREPVDDALRNQVEAAAMNPDPSLPDLHAAARAVASDDAGIGVKGLKILETAAAEREHPMAEPARLLLARCDESPLPEVRREAFRILFSVEKEERFPETLRRFLEPGAAVLDARTRAALRDLDLSDAKLEAVLRAAEDACSEQDSPEASERAEALLRFIADHGAVHPTRYRRLRAFLVRAKLFSAREDVRRLAVETLVELRGGFRSWLGPTERIAVDPETGAEYRWENVVVFDEGVEAGDRARLLSAIEETAFLREAVFLFTAGVLVRLSDLPPGGIWVRTYGAGNGKTLYRLTVQTRYQGSCDILAHLNQSLSEREVQDETHWLILCAEPGRRGAPLVDEYGGYWPAQDLWSQAYGHGETLNHTMRRLSRNEEEQERFRLSWPFFAWSALSVYVDFWDRTGRRWEIAGSGTDKVIVPTHDYHTGARLQSVASRRAHEGLIPMILSFHREFLEPVEREYPFLRGSVGWEEICSALLEVLGENEGVRLLLRSTETERESIPGYLLAVLEEFLRVTRRRGFQPMRLRFAARRYRRWARLTGGATPQARYRTLTEFWDTYGLERLSRAYPEARVRFFQQTVLADAPRALQEGLEKIIARLRAREIGTDELVDAVADLRAHLNLGEDEDYFLARLSLPHLGPNDAAGFIRADHGGRDQSEIVVMLQDAEGDLFRVRHALNPKEVGRLYRLFLATKLDIHFRPEHQYLVALNERGQIIAGIYYEIHVDGQNAHLEKIAVAERYRRKGVASGLMNEFFNRLRAAGIKTVTTGFFRPEYFYSYGFTIEKRYAGLVKTL